MTESELYGMMKKNFKSGPVHSQFDKAFNHMARIEAWNTQGICDVNWCSFGIEMWIELKNVPSGFKIKFQKYQPAWIRRRMLAGGYVEIWVWAGKYEEVWVYGGGQVFDLVQDGLKVSPLRGYPVTGIADALLACVEGARANV